MWNTQSVFIITLCMSLFNVADNKIVNRNSTTGDITCNILHPLVYAIICFLAAVIIILLIILYKIVSMQNRVKKDNIHMTGDTVESTSLHHNNALCTSLSPTSCDDGADNSSSTSSETPEGSISSSSQRYVSIPECSKTSDYINVSEGASSGRVDFKNKTTRIDYVNVKESQRKKVSGKGQARCADATSISSDASDESAVNYSKVVFTKAEKYT